MIVSEELSTRELLDELARRSISCLAIAFRNDEQGEAWIYSIKGSPIMLGAMSAALSIHINKLLNSGEASVSQY